MNRILIVEHDSDRLRHLRKLLEDRGWQVETAGTGPEALSKAIAAPPDIVVTDEFIPGIDGFALLRQWKIERQLKHVPFVIHAQGRMIPEDQQRARSLGAAAIVVGPPQPDWIISRLEEFVSEVAMSETGTSLSDTQEQTARNNEREALVRQLETKASQLEELQRALTEDIVERQRTEDQLRESRARLGAIYDAEPECVKLLDRRGYLLEINRAGLQMIEADSVEQVVGGCVYDLVVEQHREKYRRIVDLVFQGESHILEFELVGLRGGRRQLEMHATPLRDESGYVTALLGVTRDVTAHKQVEEARDQLAQRNAALVQALGEIVYEWQPENRKVAWGGDFTRVLGYSAEEIGNTTESWLDRIHPEDLDRVLAEAEAAIRQRRLFDLEYRFRRRDGSYAWMHDRGVPFIDAAGRLTRLIGVFLDISERKRAAEALSQTETLLRAILTHTTDVIFVKDPQGRYVLINQASADFVGLPMAEIQGKSDDQIFPTETARRIREVDQQLLATGGIRTFDQVVENAAGVRRVYHVTKGVITGADSQPVGVFGISRDVTGRRQMEEALCASEERFAKAFQSSPIALAILQEDDLNFLEVNDAFVRMLDCPRQETIGRTGEDLGIIADPASFQRALHDLQLGKPVKEYELSFRRRSGDLRIVSLSADRIQLGSKRCFLILLHDITPRRAAEQALQRSQQQLYDLMQSIDGIVWEVDVKTFRFTFVSPMAHRLLGYPASRWMNEPEFWANHIHPDDRVRTIRACQEFSRRGQAHELEYRMLAADGRIVWLRDIVAVVVENGQVTKLRGIMVDVTSLKLAEQQMRERQAELAHVLRVSTMSEMVAVLAHEINQPLAAISGFAQGCLSRAQTGATADELLPALQEVAAQAERASAIVRRLRGYVRKAEPQRERIEFQSLISDVVGFFQPELHASKMQIQLDVPSGPAPVLADRVQIEQVILNLLRNAIEAMSDVPTDEARLILRLTASEPNTMTVSVQDSGPGIPPDVAGRIFEPFFTTKSDGLGMGLAISRSIIESHGGRMWTSAGEERGSVFHFSLPIDRSEVQPHETKRVRGG